MIELPDPAELAQAVAAIRRSAGVTRVDMAHRMAEIAGRSLPSVVSQILHWERCRAPKVPNLASVGPYLQAHDLTLALIRPGDRATFYRCPAHLRGDITQPCAIAVGHVGTHRTLKGREFW